MFFLISIFFIRGCVLYLNNFLIKNLLKKIKSTDHLSTALYIYSTISNLRYKYISIWELAKKIAKKMQILTCEQKFKNVPQSLIKVDPSIKFALDMNQWHLSTLSNLIKLNVHGLFCAMKTNAAVPTPSL